MEKEIKLKNGYLMFVLLLIIIAGIIISIAILDHPGPLVFFPLIPIIIPGFIIVNPNGSKVVTLFGKYVGNG